MSKGPKSFLLFVIFIFLAWRFRIPIQIRTTAGHDDGLYLNGALSILNGNWLGAYSQISILKGTGYSVILAIFNLIGLNHVQILALIQLITALFLFYLLTLISTRQTVAFLGFIFFLFNPLFIPLWVSRDYLFSYLLTLSICLLLIGIFENHPKESRHRNFYFYLSYFLFGVCFSIRDESILFFISFILIHLSDKVKIKGRFNNGLKISPRAFVRIAKFFLMFILFPVSISSLNLISYGKFVINDMQESNFRTSVKLLNSVDIGPEKQYFPVPKEKRVQIYKSVPHFAMLSPYLESEQNPWKKPGCDYGNCNDYAGGWWIFAFRDAVASAGHHSTAIAASDFYGELNRQIETSCINGDMVCKRSLLPWVPRLHSGVFKDIVQSTKKTLPVLINQKIPYTNSQSWGPISSYNNFQVLLNFPPVKSPLEHGSQTFIGLKIFQNDSMLLNIGYFLLNLVMLSFLLVAQVALILRKDLRFLLVNLGLFGIVLIRVFNIALIDATSFNSINQEYLLPAISVLSLLLSLSVASLYKENKSVS